MGKILKDTCLGTELQKSVNQTIIASVFNDCNGGPLQPGDQLAKCSDIPAPSTPADGSETKILAGTNITVTGSGTVASPYFVSSPNKLFVKRTWGGIDEVDGNVHNSVIGISLSSISITNPYTYPIEVVENAKVLEVDCLNVAWATPTGLMGVRFERSTDGGATWGNHSTSGFSSHATPSIANQVEWGCSDSSYKHTIAAGATLTINYRGFRILIDGGVAMVGRSVLIRAFFGEATITQL